MSNRGVIQVSCAIIEHKGRILAAQRGKHTHNAGKWEFPGGKIEEGESPRDCLHREIREELAIAISLIAPLPVVTHHYPDKIICLHPFVCQYDGSEISPGEHQHILWLQPEEIAQLNWSEADIKVWEHYLQEYR